MTDLPTSALSNSAGVATVTLPQPQGGIRWIIWQLTVETIPVVTGAQATVRRNGRYITSTVAGSGSSAQGPPALAYNPGDQLQVIFTNAGVNTECVVTLLYEEAPAGGKGSQFGLV